MNSFFTLSLMGVLATGAAGEPQLLTLIRTPGAKPPAVIGFPLKATDGLQVDMLGKEHAVPKKSGDVKEFEDSGGEQSQGVGPGVSLRWRLTTVRDSKCYLYFLCRTGHQQGYEYVSPEMTYVVDVNARPVDMGPVTEFAAVRTYQSKDGWGHDMSWICSKAMVTVKPGDAITIGCLEKYAFVTRCTLVDEKSHRLSQLIGRSARVQERLKDADALLQKTAEVFPDASVKASATNALRELSRQRTQYAELQTAMSEAASRVERGSTFDLEPLARQAEALASEVERAEVSIYGQMEGPLEKLIPGLRSRLPAVPRSSSGNEGSFEARQADYFASVGRTYLVAAERSRGKDRTLDGLRRFATYLWRADQFASKAEASRKGAKARMPIARLSPPRLEPCERGELLLNGEWEMTTQGTPDAPATSSAPSSQGGEEERGWFKIRVPHGPWGETIGQFMALGRRWPGSNWAWYRVTFPVPATWTKGRLKLHFEAVLHLCEVYVNGQYCGRHIGGFDAFDIDITGAARPGESNELLCFVHDTSVTALDKSARKDQPEGCSSGPNHYMVSDLWGQRFGGIWQDVSLVVEPAVRVDDVFVITSYRRKTITVRAEVCNETNQPVTVGLSQDVMDGGRIVLSLPGKSVKLGARETCRVDTSAPWPTPKLWGIGGEWGEPKNLYLLRSRLVTPHLTLDTHFSRFGFREIWTEDGGFWLNGKRLPLQGGGNWYLQEGKAPHGNRWFGLHMFRSDRGMNVNIQRWHRHGDVAREFFDLGDELGMLSEPEGAYWGVYGVPDLMGFTDWEDPVWAANLLRHYRDWARKHRNHPSIALWSIENETFCSTQRPKAMVDRFVSFGRALNEEDPTRPVTFHGVENGGYCTQRDDIQVVNLHYPSDEKLRDWKKKWGGRPCINGEFQNYPVLFAMSGPDAAKSAEAVNQMSQYVEHWAAYYKQIELAGALNFLPYMVGLFTTADRSLMGPWGDLLPDPAKRQAIPEGWMAGSVSIATTVPIAWPSLSGPGIKCEQLITGTGNRSIINWFDPRRPSITPNKAYEAYARCWEKMPPLNPERAPEVIVTVTRNGTPVPNAAVVAQPLDKQATNPFGVMTDPKGTAWLVFKEPGRYELSCGQARRVFEAKRLSMNSKPGYDDVPRVNIPVGL